MDKLILGELASQITTELISRTWYWWVLAALVWIASSAIAAYFGAYLKVKAETDAIDENMQKVLDNLEQTTTRTKNIETKIDHDDWTAREWKTLRRLKMEELLAIVHKAKKWADAESSNALCDQPPNEDVPPIDSGVTITTLYLPELQTNFRSVTLKFATILKLSHDVRIEHERYSASDDVPPSWQRFADDLKVLNGELVILTVETEHAAAKLLQVIMNVQPKL